MKEIRNCKYCGNEYEAHRKDAKYCCRACCEHARGMKRTVEGTWKDRYRIRRENGICTACGAAPVRPGRATCEHCSELQKKRSKEVVSHETVDQREIRLNRMQLRNLLAKEEVFRHYGLKCACCGESDLRFLTIDHINGGGSKHTARVGRGSKFYAWLKREGFPEGFQVLCFNCNHGRWINKGVCPHKDPQ